ncbi:MAG TPA: hypothetical protein VM070_05175, partial [Candidatus Saccharimonadales bacterium]|nr:hypothetical protein [Candidatus Saccharimonadales bacterium]
MGIALLYAYKAQDRAASPTGYSAAIDEVNAGQVKEVSISGATATVTLNDGSNTKQIVNIGDDKDGLFKKAILDYNTANGNNAAKRVNLVLPQE